MAWLSFTDDIYLEPYLWNVFDYYFIFDISIVLVNWNFDVFFAMCWYVNVMQMLYANYISKNQNSTWQ